MATIDFVVKNGLVVTDAADILSTTDSTSGSDTSASLYTAGGAAIAKKLYVGTDLQAAGTTINLGTSTGTLTTTTVGGAITGNTLKIAGTAVGAINLTSDVTTGTVNLYTGVTTGTVNLATGGAATAINIGTGGASAINLGGAAGTVNIGTTAGDSILTIRGNTTTGTTTIATNAGVVTANVFNTIATTGNLFGAGTTVSIGAATGTTTINNNATVKLDLEVQGGDITTNQASFNLLNATATTISAFGAGTTIGIGAATGTTTINNANTVVTGDLAVNGGDITTSATTFNLLNTTVTTGNLFGAGTTVNIGAATGTTYVKNNLDVALDVNVQGGDITTNQTTFNLLNATATTISAFGAGTTIGIGAATGTMTLNNAIVTHPGQIISTKANSTTTGAGQIYLNGATGNRIDWATAGVSAPAFTTRSVGTKLTLYPAVAAAAADYALGIDTNTLWSSVPTTVESFKWYGGTTLAATLSGAGDLTLVGDIAVNGGDITTTVTGTTTVFNTNTTTVNAFGAGTAIAVGATTGTLTLNNPTVVGSQTTVNLWNTTSTTLSFAGAATTLNIGNTATAAQTVNFFTASTGASTYNFATGATAATTTKTLNIGTGGAASSTTNVNIGSTNGGTITLNSAVTVSGRMTFPSAVASRPILQGGFLSTVTGNTDVDIWGVSTDRYPSIGTSLAFGIQWSGTNNDLYFIGANTQQHVFDFDAGNYNAAGNIIAGSATKASNTVIRVLSADAYNAGFEAYGNSQGTGYLYVGQDASYGGGIMYNGDGTPAFAGSETADYVSFYRTNAGTKTVVFEYAYSGDQVNFKGDVVIALDLAVNGGDITTSATTFNFVNANATTVTMAGAATALTIGGAAAAQTITIGGGSTGASTYNFGTGVTAAATTKTLNIGTGGAASSTTNVNIGSSVAGTITLNSPTTTTAGQYVSTKAGSTTDAAGNIYLNGATSNRIDWNANGVAAPAFTTRSAGTKLTLYPAVSASGVDYGFGIDSSTLWSSVPTTSESFKWYGGTTVAATLTGTGILTLVGDLAVNGGDITSTSTTFNHVVANATTVTEYTAATTLNIGNATAAQTISIGNASTATSTYNFGTGATAASTTKTVNIGTAGVASSTVNINIGTAGVASSTVNINIGTGSGASTVYLGNTTAGTVIANNVIKTGLGAATTALDFASTDGYASMRVIRNTASATYNDGMYIGYGNTNSGVTRLFGGGATTVSASVNANGTAATTNSTGSLVVNGGVSSNAQSCFPNILIDRSGNTGSGIKWYSSSYTAWSQYMAQAAQTSVGPSGTVTAPSGTLVTSWALRSFIENSAGYGWTFESGTSTSTAPSVVAEIRYDGAAKFNGAIYSGSYFAAGTSIAGGYYQDSTNGAYRSIVTSGDSGYYFQSNNGAATTMYVGLLGTYAGRVGVGTTTPGYTLQVAGSFAATTKSFVIDHPTKEGKKLRYGSLEGPENGVYVRGRLTGKDVIELPDYWTGLVDENSITVNLTAIGSSQDLYVKDIKDNKVYVGSAAVDCFYTVYAERKDVDKLVVEFDE